MRMLPSQHSFRQILIFDLEAIGEPDTGKLVCPVRRGLSRKPTAEMQQGAGLPPYLVTTLISNTKGDQKGGDPFWEKSETLLYTALIAYLHYESPKNEQNFSTLAEMIGAMEVREDDEEFKNVIDLMFDALAEKDPEHFAVRQYRKYKLAAGKTAKSILISCGARLAAFDIAEIREITMYDELELDTLGDRKTAMFFIISDTDASFNFLVSMAYTQLFNLLCEKADDVYGGRLPIHVRCLIESS